MSSEQAFEMLFTSVTAALTESLARHSQAALRGDLEALEAETDLQRRLVVTRNRVQDLRDMWPLPLEVEPVTSRPETHPLSEPRPDAGTLGPAQRTPARAFYLPILQVLKEMGGRGTVADVLDRVSEIMADKLSDHDRAPLASGPTRWRNTAHSARYLLKERGLIAANSPKRIWEITDSGWKYLQEQGK